MEVRKVHNFESELPSNRYIIDLNEEEAFEFDQFISDNLYDGPYALPNRIHNALYGHGLQRLYKAKWRKEYGSE